jgi:hypothetical protein
MNTNTSTANPSQKISAKEIHAKWEKISDQEASGMKNKGDLVSQVQAKYSLNPEQARQQVDTWAAGRDF